MPRRYEQRRRAQQQEETRQRIVRAAVELHEEVGPAHASLSAIAERAGVQRNTLYRHFPDERSLYWACSGLHEERHPFPDPAAWAGVEASRERARLALRELFAYWESTEAMTAKVLRDAEADDLVREVATRRTSEPMAAIRDAIASAWPAERRHERLLAAIGLAVSFRTWQSLVRDGGLSSPEAADLATAMLSAAADT